MKNKFAEALQACR